MTDEKPGSALSRSVDLLWQPPERPRRGPKPSLSIERIVAAAIEIADAEGLEALSMQRMAGQLGFTAMSLYRYVPSKDHLIDIMLDAASGPAPELASVEGDWRTRIEAWVTALWERFQRHPWMLRAPISSPPIGPNQLAWFESCLQVLATTGLNEDEMVSLTLFLNSATQGLARTSMDLAQAWAEGEPDHDYGAVLARLTRSTHYPTLSRLVAAGAFRPADGGAGNTVAPNLQFGIRRLLDGLEAYVDRRTGRGA
ncbi:TetR/AcrR family transcriptional regulator [Natronosporangium hydrolyticum]|uniref:TetR/AcrR family transcriptional regulator n=1 Tax=Natronosporangium hydrolyticum TaxID=2811111 RepID=UPI001EFA281C|nr:TetR/AcrR family transcriptional regulator [Natronosporangium hydrolyticum]